MEQLEFWGDVIVSGAFTYCQIVSDAWFSLYLAEQKFVEYYAYIPFFKT